MHTNDIADTAIAETRHPLTTDITLEEPYTEWRKAWDNEKIFRRKLGLLHSVWFTTHPWGESHDAAFGEIVEKTLLCLSLADGYNDPSAFDIPGEIHIYHLRSQTSLREARQELSKKAFQGLCAHVFKSENEIQTGGVGPSWLHSYVQDERILRKVVWFLRTRANNIYGRILLYNLNQKADTDDYHQKILREFAFRLVKLSFEFETLYVGCHGYRDPNLPENKKLRALFNELEPEMVKILAGLDALHFLLDTEKYPLSIAGFEALKEIALTETFNFWDDNQRRCAKTLEEASWGGSKAAQIYLLLKINEKERGLQIASHGEKSKSGEPKRRQV